MSNPNPLLIVDVSCLIWKILDQYSSVLSLRPQFAAKWLRAQWAMMLHRPSDLFPADWIHDTILVFDVKKRGQYWRHTLAPTYKGGRGEKSPEYHQTKRMLLRMLREPQYRHLRVWGCPHFEADDFVAEVTRLIGSDRQAWIVSVDGDLLQLVRPNVGFAWTYNGKDRLKDVALAHAYIEHKLKIHLRSLGDFGKIKSIIGDASDNLPQGGDTRIFDLSQPDRQYSLEQSFHGYAAMKSCLGTSNWVNNQQSYNNALKWCSHMGLPISFANIFE
jgi:5'-3' exonuclease